MHYYSLPYRLVGVKKRPKGAGSYCFSPFLPDIFLEGLPANLCGGSAESNKKQSLRSLRLERSGR